MDKKFGYNIYTIMQDDEGYLWLGSKGGGVLVSEKKVTNPEDIQKQIRFYQYQYQASDSLSLSNNTVYDIIQDSQNRTWIGTYGGGLNLVTSRKKNRLNCRRINSLNSNISSNQVRQILEDSQHRIWVATTFGLNLISNSPKRHQPFDFRIFIYDPNDSLSISYNDVLHIFEDSQNRLWFGTFGGGINRLIDINPKKARFEHFTQKDGLVNESIFSIIEDKNGFLWFGTEKGIAKFNFKTQTFENFDKHNGLPVDNFCENTIYLTHNDNILFGNMEGILAVYPEKIRKTKFKPPIVLTNFQIFNKDVDYTNPDAPFHQHIETCKKITLAHNQSSFSIEYTALSYFAPTKNIYHFKLENFDDYWNEVGNQTKATYTNLPPGKYIFKVKAANWDNTWNENPRVLEIHILPPWWKTNIAYLLYFVTALLLFIFFRRYYLHYQHLQNELKVEKRVNEIKLRFFTDISHEIRTPLTLILAPLQDILTEPNLKENIKKQLKIMEKNGGRMLKLINQLLDFRKIQKNKMNIQVQETELVPFLRDIVQSFSQMAEHKKIQIEFTTDKDQLKAWIDTQKFDSVVFNIFSNALKFTEPGKKISLHILSKELHYIDIKIIDQGKGIPDHKKELLFQRFTTLSTEINDLNSSGIGLSLANEITKLHGGKILVDSEVGKGSCFTIRIPKGKNHFKKSMLIPNKEVQTIQKQTLEPNTNYITPSKTQDINNQKSKAKILLVEDNEEILAYLQNSLQDIYYTQTATNGKEALVILPSFHPDIIITDVMMPELSGTELIQELKNSIEYSHIPVIMLTAKSNIEDQVIGIESGAEAYILKPFNNQYLNAVIKNLLRQRKIVYQKYFQRNLTESTKVNISSKDEKFMLDIVKLVEENYQNPEFNVDQLVKMSYVSRTVFYNKIKGLTGLSPNDFLRRMRLKIAADFLATSEYNVSEVANIIGFNDVRYFRQRFKEIYHCSPSEFKKNKGLQRKS